MGLLAHAGFCVCVTMAEYYLFETNFLPKTLSLLCRYGSPILDIRWHRTLNSEQPQLITTDSHVVRIWDPETVRQFSIV